MNLTKTKKKGSYIIALYPAILICTNIPIAIMFIASLQTDFSKKSIHHLNIRTLKNHYIAENLTTNGVVKNIAPSLRYPLKHHAQQKIQ